MGVVHDIGELTTSEIEKLSLQDLYPPNPFDTYSLRRTKATLIYRRTGNLRAVQLLLGHSKIENTIRYSGMEGDDALAIAEQVDV
jgi:integrase